MKFFTVLHITWIHVDLKFEWSRVIYSEVIRKVHVIFDNPSYSMKPNQTNDGCYIVAVFVGPRKTGTHILTFEKVYLLIR